MSPYVRRCEKARPRRQEVDGRSGPTINHPQAARRYLALRAETRAPDYRFKILRHDKVVYIETPKAACSTIEAQLASHAKRNAGYPERGLSSIREIGVPAFFDLIDDPATFVFTFVRNPYTRLISAYRDKFRHPIGRSDYYLDALRYFGLKLLRLDRTEPLPFEWFVDLATGTCRSGSDGHWMLMTSLVPSTSLECSFLGRVERFDEDFRMVLDRIGEPVSRFPPSTRLVVSYQQISLRALCRRESTGPIRTTSSALNTRTHFLWPSSSAVACGSLRSERAPLSISKSVNGLR